METAVRSARPHDVGALAELERDARQALVDQRGGPQLLAEEPPVGSWAALLDRDHVAVLVGTIDEHVVAYLELVLDGTTARVRQVYVEPEARELGFGDEMLAQAIALARDRGCSALEGTALPGDRLTKNLYERAAITTRKLTVWTAL
ncbi:MAG: GNAT family N-acetyltransferase [Ilumatobacteraceae bacterium]